MNCLIGKRCLQLAVYVLERGYNHVSVVLDELFHNYCGENDWNNIVLQEILNPVAHEIQL